MAWQGSWRAGAPPPNTRLYVVGPRLQPVPFGAPGELWIGGEGLGRGYLGRPELTAERFVPDPFVREMESQGERLYRTGDLVRFRPEGDLEFLGRIDSQIKIRGFRIEPGEIETELVGYGEGEVREAAVLVAEDPAGGMGLVACVAGQAKAGALRRYLLERLPDYMVPSHFAFFETLPLTPNGKVDRKELARTWREKASVAKEAAAGEAEPRTWTEELAAGIFAELLQLPRVDREESFFALGGHSLLATQAISRVQKAFGVEMSLRAFFEAPTVAALAGKVEALRSLGDGPQVPPIVPVPREGPLPLSFAQQRLWFIDQLKPGTSLYNIPVGLRAKGPLHLTALELCLSEIVRRHEILRTVFASVDGSPVQVIQPAAPFVLPMVDLSELPESECEALAVTLAGEEAGRPFDLAQGPLLRGVLLRLAEENHVAALTMHHIVSDGWSMGVLVREVMALYQAFLEEKPSPLPELPVQYADFAVWQHGWFGQEVLEKLIEYWRRRLAGALPQLDLPGTRPRPATLSPRGAKRQHLFSPPLLEQLRTFGRRESATLFMTLLAPLQALLYSRTGATDLVVGTDVAGRGRRETEGLIGFFINQLPLRADLTGDPTLRELLGRVRETALEAYSHQDLPFDHLVEALRVERSLQRSPVFQVKLVLLNIPREDLELPGLTLEVVPLSIGTAQLDLHWGFAESGEDLWLTLTYSTDLYDESLIDSLLDEYEVWLHAFTERPEARLGEVVAEIAQAERARRAELEIEIKSVGLAKLRSRRRQAVELEGQFQELEV
jgi:acyl carrier protein